MSAKSPDAESSLFFRFAETIRGDRALIALNAIAREMGDLSLVVLVRTDYRHVEFRIPDGTAVLPSFCEIFRRLPGGVDACAACRTLLAFSACQRGMNEFICHGGVSVLASPAIWPNGSVSRRVVAATTPFARSATGTGWALDTPQMPLSRADLDQLRSAYGTLPAFPKDRRELAQKLIEVAAHLLGDREQQHVRAESGTVQADAAVGRRWCYENLEACWSVLGEARRHGLDGPGEAAGTGLVSLVVAMVKRDPAAPYTVAGIARAARMSPNHFSTLFHRITGTNFQVFLCDTRIAFATRLLRDTPLDIAEVSRKVGFSDPAYFSRRFKQSTGLSPTQWRVARPAEGAEEPRNS
jgi:AraC-like DNA-binding protein